MSEPVTNIEIEDVLSSIRRLVSDEARSPARQQKEVGFKSDVPPQAVEIEQENPLAAEKDDQASSRPALVLTPALRVEDEAVEMADVASSDAVDAVSDPQIDETLILTPNLGFEEAPVAFDPQTAGLDEPVAFAQDESAQEESVQDESAQDDNAKMDEDASAVTEAIETHPEYPSADQLADEESAEENTTADADEESAVPEVLAESVEETAKAALEEPQTIEAKIAALESLISRGNDDFEPDGAEDGGNAGRPGNALPWEDSHENRVKEKLSHLPDPDDETQSASFDTGFGAFERARAEAVNSAQAELNANVAETLLDNEDLGTVLDEDALRDMVAEIVRQELQGPLGERITRNVRKLVRREIYRALAANELD